ncbi:hypothetical protein NQ315_005389 [Exocentrus adspersus]|uniref:Transposase n=1 Tax=Exocentrus adspersus TaxID=1586481 RepID=A0AAV8W2F3_9CUCU|nr:hypothetical protein NQ315_005389 [Exocentrus adspersus]
MLDKLITALSDQIAIRNKVSKQLKVRYEMIVVTVVTIEKAPIEHYKRRKTPKYTVAQLENIPRCCRALRRLHFPGKFIIMDDEQYFTLSNSEIRGNDGFCTRNAEEAPDRVRFKGKVKFADKILVWCAISEAGVSQPYVGRVCDEAITADIYIERCLSKLRNFINTHNPNDEVMFWPDLASCHYARKERQNG